ncbi:MAG: hypothetical protein ACYDDA_05815 [Acidiferrobacteraceae bacterium]
MATNNLFHNINNNAGFTAPSTVGAGSPATTSTNASAQKSERLPFGYVVSFPSYTATATAGTLGIDNIQNLKINNNSNFEVIKQLKWDSGGGNGYLNIISNGQSSLYGISSVTNVYNGYANINTVFGNSEFNAYFEKPLVLPATRELIIKYKDITATSGNLYLLFMGSQVFPANTITQNYLYATIPSTSYPIQYPVTLTTTQANGTTIANITIPQGQNFVWTGITINDSNYPVLINFSISQLNDFSLFSSGVISRLINGTTSTNAPSNNLTPSGVRPFMLPTYVNLVSKSAVQISVSDISGTSGYNTDVTLWGYVTQATSSQYY